MLELASALLPHLRTDGRVAVVTVTRVARSAPRGVGASMAVTIGGEVIGSISGGCVEGDAVMLAHEAMRANHGRFGAFGFTDEMAHAAGLACGGSIEVVAYPVDSDDDFAMRALERAAADHATRVGLVVRGEQLGCLVPAPDAPAGDATAGDVTGDTLILTHRARPRLIVLGAGEHAAALCRVATAAGFAVTVCDAWPLLVTRDRFADAAELIAALPHEYLAGLAHEPEAIDERTAVCVLTHDERLDVPALRVALTMPVGFVGAMGARSTVARREALLTQSGLSAEALARLHSPIGLDLGGSSPDDTAVAVVAEIIAARHGATAMPLRSLSGPLHRATDRCEIAGSGREPAHGSTRTS